MYFCLVIKHLVHLLVFLNCSFFGRTQELVFSNISNEMQLPSQECYKIHQDKQGYIWFSTDNGLCRYGNGSLKIFDDKNGLPEESVYNISEDPSGTMWFATSDNRILYFENGKLLEAAFNKAYQKPAVKGWSHPTPLFLDMSDPDNSLIANCYYSFRVKRSSNSAYLFPKTSDKTSVQFIKKKGHAYLPNQFKKINSQYFTVQLINEKKNTEIVLTDLPVKNIIYWNTPTAFTGNTDFIGIQNKLLKVNADFSYSAIHFPGRILSLYVDQSNGLWVGVQNDGVYYYSDVNTMKLSHHSLTNFSITGVCEDQEGGIWCSSLERGIFYTRNKHLLSYSSIPGFNKRMTLLKFVEGNLFASASNLALFHWKKQSYNMHKFQLDEVRFSDIVMQKNDWLLTGNDIMIRTTNDFVFKERLMQLPFHNVACNELASGNDQRIFGILNKNFMEVGNSKMVKLVYYNSIYSSKTILHKSGNVFLLGGDQGLYEFNIVTLRSRKITGVPDKIKKIIKTRSGRIWIATKNDGIYWLDDGKVTNASKILLLKTRLFYDLIEDLNGHVWAGSNQGLYRFSETDKKQQTICYNLSHGLPSNEVYKVAADEQKIWFSTFEGLFNLPLSVSSLNTTGPEIHLQKLRVKNKIIPNEGCTLQFPYNQNDFRFTFDILTFKNGANTQLEYLLKHEDQSKATKLSGNELFLENLDPGRYQLMVFGINNDGVRSPKPEVFLITIEAPFYQTWWFISLTSLIVLLCVFMIVRLIVRSIRKKEEAKTLVNKLMAEYQITALQAQMNPHFIFNAINTIQGYILEKSEDEAYDYLAKFGKLIRTVLHHSQEKVLLLEHELEVLNLYIELEQLRFDHCFDYELILSETVFPEDIYLPGMILQPYVENAIWHGIVNLRGNRRGKLEVIITVQNTILIVTIKDNGIGREMAMSFNKDRRHKSVGMQLTGERINVMNQLHGYETASVTITDLFDEDGEARGTSVEVRIPITIES
jgi:ligand-binding sensor domain-containing protein